MSLIQPLTRSTVPPEVSRPDPSKVIAGDPVQTTWNIEDRDGLFCGLWHSTPGKWRIHYTEWEYFHILEGVSIVTGADGQSVTLRAGQGWILRPGFEGTWEVVEPTLKDYVIRT